MRVQKNYRTRRLLKLARQVEDLVRQLHRHVHQAGGLSVAPWNAVHSWDKVRLSAAELLQDARWEIVKHCRLPSLEQVCRQAADLRAEARQAHEDDREKAKQVHTLVAQAWISIFKMNELGTRPTWSQLESEFGEHIPSACECIVNELNCKKLTNACKRMKKHECSWSRRVLAELQTLPLQHLEKLAEVLNLVEETGTQPVPLTRGLISLIPKGGGSAPQKTEAGRPHGFCVQAVGFVQSS